MRLSAFVFIVAIVPFLLAPQRCRAGYQDRSAPLTAKEISKKAFSLAKQVLTAIDVADLLDELTTTKGEPVLKSIGKIPIDGKSYHLVEFLVPDVVVEDFVTNSLLGSELPGRRISVTISVDCLVECRIAGAKIRVAKHEEYDDTFIITIPQLEIIGRVPEGQGYSYEIEYGSFRSRWVDFERAHNLRKLLVRQASKKASEYFRTSEKLKEFRKNFKYNLRQDLKRVFPKNYRIDIRFEDE